MSDYPEDVMKTAKAIYDWWSNGGASISTRTLLEDGIARAIMAERARCAKIADAAVGKALDRPAASPLSRLAVDVIDALRMTAVGTADGIARAIRGDGQ